MLIALKVYRYRVERNLLIFESDFYLFFHLFLLILLENSLESTLTLIDAARNAQSARKPNEGHRVIVAHNEIYSTYFAYVVSRLTFSRLEAPRGCSRSERKFVPWNWI